MYAPYFPVRPEDVYQQPRTRSISIYDDFNPTWEEIVHYLEYRSTSRPFVDATDGRRNLWSTVISRCLTTQQSRNAKQTPPGRPIELEYVTVTGLHGLKLRISDFYTALGLIITETEPYIYHGYESDEQIEEIHLKMLATYSKWILIASDAYFRDPPTTACVMFVKDLQLVSAKRPILSASSEPMPELGSSYAAQTFMPAACFPNLSGVLKSEAVKLQQKNLQGFANGFQLSGKSPQELRGMAVQYGHCSEGPALLYMLDPTNTHLRSYLWGAATHVQTVKLMEQYEQLERNWFKRALIKACLNCHYMIRAANEAFGTGHFTSQYRDLAVSPPEHIPNSNWLKCPNQWLQRSGRLRPCDKNGTRCFECPYCKLAWYCSQVCREYNWPAHALWCTRYKWCAKLGCSEPAEIKCEACPSRRIPARYCTVDHLRKDWPNHEKWCYNRDNMGPVPNLAHR
ncbi:hypothetical protein FB451DRAFT_129687 [Mycena latifolia]|nr:hypothetical protein FB451DRAFT_129687 [Mycena latifolia]